jgi:hypothetical protein
MGLADEYEKELSKLGETLDKVGAPMGNSERERLFERHVAESLPVQFLMDWVRQLAIEIDESRPSGDGGTRNG